MAIDRHSFTSLFEHVERFELFARWAQQQSIGKNRNGWQNVAASMSTLEMA